MYVVCSIQDDIVDESFHTFWHGYKRSLKKERWYPLQIPFV
jgi:hypothetical protein